MLSRTGFALLAVISSAGFAADHPKAYRAWISPDRAFQCEVPTAWQSGTKKPGRLFIVGPEGEGISVSSFPKDGNYASPDAFVRAKSEFGLVGKITEPVVGGRRAKRFEKELARRSDIVRDDENHLNHEVYVVVPAGRDFYVLHYSADAAKYKEALPQFEHLLATFRLEPAPAK